MREFVIGDIHGGYRALIQCLKGVNFDYEKDKLITLGDLVDGWSESTLVIDELKKIKNLIKIMGNHDYWFLEYGVEAFVPDTRIIYNESFMSWIYHGGQETLDSYVGKHPDYLINHVNFIKESLFYYVDEKNRLFIHGGYNNLNDLRPDNTSLFWNRRYWELIKFNNSKDNNFYEVYIGHTPTINKDMDGKDAKPITINNVTNMDSGSCFTGTLSIMNINTKEIFISDVVKDLYPNEVGRNKGVILNFDK